MYFSTRDWICLSSIIIEYPLYSGYVNRARLYPSRIGLQGTRSSSSPNEHDSCFFKFSVRADGNVVMGASHVNFEEKLNFDSRGSSHSRERTSDRQGASKKLIQSSEPSCRKQNSKAVITCLGSFISLLFFSLALPRPRCQGLDLSDWVLGTGNCSAMA